MMNKTPVRTLFHLIGYLLLLFNCPQSFSISQVGLPTSLCSSASYQCDPVTERRWSLFQSSAGLNTDSKNQLTIGPCSMNGRSDSETYVLLALLHQIDDIYFDAKISFHDDLSDYRNTPVTELLSVFPEIEFNRNLMSITDSHAYIDYTSFSPFRYWIRHNSYENKLLMVAYFGFDTTFLCEFDLL